VLNACAARVFAHVQTLSVGYFDRTKAGRIISRADRDVDTLEPMLIQGPPQFLSAVLRLASRRPAMGDRADIAARTRRRWCRC
jgi:ATP-binding cassette subfamily B protein